MVLVDPEFEKLSKEQLWGKIRTSSMALTLISSAIRIGAKIQPAGGGKTDTQINTLVRGMEELERRGGVNPPKLLLVKRNIQKLDNQIRQRLEETTGLRRQIQENLLELKEERAVPLIAMKQIVSYTKRLGKRGMPVNINMHKLGLNRKMQEDLVTNFRIGEVLPREKPPHKPNKPHRK